MKSASFNIETIKFGNFADTWPTVSFHFVVILKAVQVGDHIRSSSLGSFLTDWVSGSDVINAEDLFVFWACVIIGGGESDEGSKGN